MSKKNLIGFSAYEYIGAEVKSIDGKILKKYEDIYPGAEIAAPDFFGYVKAVVRDMTMAETENNIFILEFDKDDRHCWISVGMANKKALEKLKIK